MLAELTQITRQARVGLYFMLRSASRLGIIAFQPSCRHWQDNQGMDRTQQLIASAQRTIRIEYDAIGALSGRIDSSFVKACELMLACESRIIVTGMGKSGHIARKIAATLSSTGSPAVFVHPAEASQIGRAHV